MQIILLEQVRKLGNVGDIVDVKNGYARNFLIPNGKALRANKANVDLFEQKKKDIQAANENKIKDAEKQQKDIEGKVVPVVMQAAEDGRLYGSVGANVIADALETAAKVGISRKQVMLNNPIKYIGVHRVDIDLFGNVTATIHVNIARSETEADEAAERFARGEEVMEGPGAPANELGDAGEEAIEVAVPDAEAAEDADAADAGAESAEEAAA